MPKNNNKQSEDESVTGFDPTPSNAAWNFSSILFQEIKFKKEEVSEKENLNRVSTLTTVLGEKKPNKSKNNAKQPQSTNTGGTNGQESPSAKINNIAFSLTSTPGSNPR